MRGELEDSEIFYKVKEAQAIIKMWDYHYNMVRPHRSMSNNSLAPAIVVVQCSQIQQVILTS